MNETTTSKSVSYPVWEGSLPRRFGISRTETSSLRKQHLLEGIDWVVVDRKIMLSEKAVARLETALGTREAAPPAADPPQAQKNSPAPPVTSLGPVKEELTVVSSPKFNNYHFPNKGVIKAQRDSGEVVTVTVGDSRNYTPKTPKGEPMKILAQLEKGADYQRWVRASAKPRWKGVY